MSSKELSKQRYSQFADGYVTSITHAKGADLDMLVEIAQPQSTWHVLDIATGGGHTALKFAPLVEQVVSSDLTPNMLKKAAEFILGQGIKNVAFELADAENLPFEDRQFDLVTCRIAPHHFPNVGQFVQEADRVLKSGGMLLVQDHVLSEDTNVGAIADHFEKVRDPSHNRAYAATEWVTFFEAAGLKVISTSELTKRHAFMDWAKRQGNDSAIIQKLVDIVANASADVKDWMEPRAWGTEDASFVNHHIIVAGIKSDSQK